MNSIESNRLQAAGNLWRERSIKLKEASDTLCEIRGTTSQLTEKLDNMSEAYGQCADEMINIVRSFMDGDLEPAGERVTIAEAKKDVHTISFRL